MITILFAVAAALCFISAVRDELRAQHRLARMARKCKERGI